MAILSFTDKIHKKTEEAAAEQSDSLERPDLEVKVLASLFRHPELFRPALEVLETHTTFTDSNHRMIFKAMSALVTKRRSFELELLSEELKLLGAEELASSEDLSSIGSIYSAKDSCLDFCEMLNDLHRRRAFRRACISSINSVSNVSKPIDETMSKHAVQLLKVESRDRYRSVSSGQGIDLLEDAQKNHSHLFLKTDQFMLDDVLGGGLRLGHYHLIGGRPKAGKTSLAVHIVASILEHHKRSEWDKRPLFVDWFTTEIGPAMMTAKFLSRIALHNVGDFFNRHNLPAEESRIFEKKYSLARSEFLSYNLSFHYNLSLEKIVRIMKSQRTSFHSAYGDEYAYLCVFDYMQGIEPEARMKGERESIMHTTKTISEITEELGVASLGLFHMKEDGEAYGSTQLSKDTDIKLLYERPFRKSRDFSNYSKLSVALDRHRSENRPDAYMTANIAQNHFYYEYRGSFVEVEKKLKNGDAN